MITVDEKTMLKKDISSLTKQINGLRKEVILCDDIAERSQVIKEKLDIIRQEERQGKEEYTNCLLYTSFNYAWLFSWKEMSK